MQGLQKQSRICIQQWLDAASGEACCWPGCDVHDRTIVAAHSNMLSHGKGIGKKSHDIFIAFLCSTCHYEYDFGKNLPREEKEIRFYMAMSKTWERLYRLGYIQVGKPAHDVPFG